MFLEGKDSLGVVLWKELRGCLEHGNGEVER